MPAIQIRDVPEDVRDALAAQARSSGRSLQSYLLELVTAQARRSRNAAVLAGFSGRGDGTASAPGRTADELRDVREHRE
ncbi:MAG: FitA-like ribbon-helix-helix domain-containing protein [Pseudonocardiaceae bacterium]